MPEEKRGRGRPRKQTIDTDFVVRLYEIDQDLKLKRKEHQNYLKMESENLKEVNKLMKEREKIRNEMRDKARLGSEEERRWHFTR